jgi:hypothetical protein
VGHLAAMRRALLTHSVEPARFFTRFQPRAPVAILTSRTHRA